MEEKWNARVNCMFLFFCSVRNAGNLVPHAQHFQDEYFSCEPAALELGCVVNDIRHIIVCGHSDCKAMNLLYKLRNKEEASLVSKWISLFIPHNYRLFYHIRTNSVGKTTFITTEGLAVRACGQLQLGSIHEMAGGWHDGTIDLLIRNANAKIHRLHRSGK